MYIDQIECEEIESYLKRLRQLATGQGIGKTTLQQRGMNDPMDEDSYFEGWIESWLMEVRSLWKRS